MTAVAEFTLRPGEFPLGTLFTHLPEVTVQLEPLVAHADGTAPYFWVRGAGPDAVTSPLAEHPGLGDVRRVDSVGDDHLMRCRWVADHDGLLAALGDADVVLCSAVGTSDEWTFEVRGESRDAVGAFRQSCHDRDVPVVLRALRGIESPDAGDGLTDKQREALVVAYDRGYFASPREATLADVAREFDISQQALASRLRRGTRRLVEQVLVDP